VVDLYIRSQRESGVVGNVKSRDLSIFVGDLSYEVRGGVYKAYKQIFLYVAQYIFYDNTI
jgi:hypothetical protein